MDTQQQRKLALELANALNDMDSLTLHLGFAEKYSEDFLRKTLAKVMAIPEENIRKTRGALFTHLVNNNGYRSRH